MRTHLLIPLVLLFALFAGTTEAVIVDGSDGSGTNNTTLSQLESAFGTSFPYYDNIIQTGNGTSLYLGQGKGKGWLLTANHVSVSAGSSVSIQGNSYSVIASNRISGVDLKILEIDNTGGLPNLPDVTLSSASPTVGTSALMIGFGRNRVEQDGTSKIDTAYGKKDGYTWTGARIKRWGANEISDPPSYYYGIGSSIPTNLSGYGMSLFTEFNDNQCQGSSGDSGGPVFVESNGVWELAGVMVAIFNISEQTASTAVVAPEGISSPWQNVNLTASLDIATYRSTIMQTTDLGTPPDAEVEGRYVFYNQSAWDNNDVSATAEDDNAIATDKAALLPGETATFANYTSYFRGINGMMIDVSNLAGTPTASDFDFKVGNDQDPSGWGAAAAPSSITVRPGEGTGGSDRVTILWDSGSIQKCWLEVTVKATANTGLIEDDTFYFGNAIGETGNSAVDAAVNGWDQFGVASNPRTSSFPGPVTDPYDFNRDRFVNGWDDFYVRSFSTTSSTMLVLLSLESAQTGGVVELRSQPVGEFGLLQSEAGLAAEPPPSGEVSMTLLDHHGEKYGSILIPHGAVLQSTEDLKSWQQVDQNTDSRETAAKVHTFLLNKQSAKRFFRILYLKGVILKAI